MANKKKTTEPVVEEVKKTTTKAKTNEEKSSIDLEKQNAELLELIKSMKSEIDILKSQQTPVIIQQNANSDLTRTVKVTSLIANDYILSTEPNGRGAVFRFSGYGDSKNIKFTEMQSVLQIYGKQFEEGFAVLENKKDYEDLGIGYVYDNILSKEDFDKLLELDSDESIEKILELSDDMLENVLRIIANNIINHKNYDYNKINTLQQETDLEKYIKLG